MNVPVIIGLAVALAAALVVVRFRRRLGWLLMVGVFLVTGFLAMSLVRTLWGFSRLSIGDSETRVRTLLGSPWIVIPGATVELHDSSLAGCKEEYAYRSLLVRTQWFVALDSERRVMAKHRDG